MMYIAIFTLSTSRYKLKLVRMFEFLNFYYNEIIDKMTTNKANFNNARKKAESIIKDLGFIEPPISPAEVAAKLGLSVYQAAMPEKWKDVAGYIDFDNKRIIVNMSEPQNRQSFTIAHEIGHYLLHKDQIEADPKVYKVLYRNGLYYEDKTPLEQEANCFAANLLVPKDMLETYKDYPANVLASLFQVSQQVINFSLRDLKRYGKTT